ncbi:MAG: ABC transporter permease [Anaerolineae bacterium]|nr:ABC transporter permease [Anaerolineae bacterium]
MWTLRDVRVRYKQSVVGIGWAVLQPLSLMLMFTLVFSVIVRVPTGDVPYPLFSYTAVLPWTFFAASIGMGVPSLVNNMNLVTKVRMPREILPMATVLASLVDFAIASLVFVGMIVFYRVSLQWTALWVFPLLVIQIVLTIGVVLLGSSLNVIYRDIRFIVPLATQLWMYASPIIYPVDMVPEPLRPLYFLNPMAGIIEGYRLAILEGLPPDLGAVGLSLLVSTVIFVLGYLAFKRLEPVFADLI